MVQVGDHVVMRHPKELRSSKNKSYEVMAIPLRENMKPTWWELKGDEDGVTYVITVPLMFCIML